MTPLEQTLIGMSITGLLVCCGFLTVIGAREAWRTWRER